jgi:hypothetical protein
VALALFVMLAIAAVLVSLKSMLALLTIVEVPALLLAWNDVVLLLVMRAFPAVLLSWKTRPPLLMMVTGTTPMLAEAEFRKIIAALLVNVWLLVELLVMPVPRTTRRSSMSNE